MRLDRAQLTRINAGWRPWMFLKLTADDGSYGWADCTEAHGSQPGLAAAIEDLAERIIGRDPRPIELIFEDLYRITRQSSGGLVQKALAAIENALLDLKARSLGLSVSALLGGPMRTKLKAYWSHCGSTRVRQPAACSVTPIRRVEDLAMLCAEVAERGFRAVKTNMLILDGAGAPFVVSQGFRGGEGSFDRNIDAEYIEQVVRLCAAFREGLGPRAELILDINMHLRADGVARLAQALKPYDLAWLEVDLDDPAQLAYLRGRIPMPLGSCEKRQLMSGYKPFLDSRAMDIAIIDVRWTGVMQAKRIADLARLYDVNVAPHNHGSPLATLMAAQFGASIANLRMMEYDVDDVPWRDELLTNPLEFADGHLILPDGPGWGVEIDEARLMELAEQ